MKTVGDIFTWLLCFHRFAAAASSFHPGKVNQFMAYDRLNCPLAPSASLASADGTSFLVQQILPSNLLTTTYKECESAFLSWKENLPKDTSPPSPANTHQQKAWDQPRVQHRFHSLISNVSNPHTKARLLASSTKESGDRILLLI